MFSAKLLRPYPRRRLLLALSVGLAAATAATVGLMIVAAPASAAQPVSFTPAPGSPFPVGTYPQGITSADFNGDQKPDLAVTNVLSNNVTVLLGNGSGGFTSAPGSPSPVGSGPQEITSADFNGDQKPDLAVTN